jgi:Undecaprenyl-phosphate glucose phosphotransferase
MAHTASGQPSVAFNNNARVLQNNFSTPSTLEWLPSLIIAAVRLMDAGVIMGAAALAYFIYLDDIPAPINDFYIILVGSAAIVQFNILQFSDVYQFKSLANLAHQIGRSVIGILLTFLVLVVLLYLTKQSATYSRGWMLIWFVLATGGVVVVRLGLSAMVHTFIRQGMLARRVAIVGSGRPADRLAEYLAGFENAHVQFMGCFDDRIRPREDGTLRQPTGSVDELCRLARTQAIDAIILAMPQISEDRLAMIMAKFRSLPVDVRLCRDTLEYCLPQSTYEFCGVVPLLRLYDKPVSGWGLLLKSFEDKVLSAGLMILGVPLMLAIAVLIKLDSRGPVLFKQKRYGFNNRLITVYKFRTMYADQTDANAERLTTRDDPRVTRIGRFLRSTSLDEIPQLINVVLGDMSIVGPRPHAISAKAAGELYEEVVAEYAARHRVKPGITGWAQVNGWRGETDTVEKIRERVKCDLFYIDNWSLWLDIKILLMTAYAVFKRENAY